MVSIVIPSYNQGKFLGEAIKSCLMQNYEDKEVLVVDNASTDNSVEVIKSFPVRLVENKDNIGLTANLNECIKQAKGEYIVFLCSDDMFADPNVISDIVKLFDLCPNVSVVDRPYYQYMDGYPGAVVEVREPNVLMSVINPSGVGIRKIKAGIISDKIYVEFPAMVKEMLKDSDYKRLTYDAVAVRIHKNNLATKKEYYKGSSTKNLYELLGKDMKFDFKSGAICLKNRVGNTAVIKEAIEGIKIRPSILLSPSFWFWNLFALLTPACVLRSLSDLYRHRIGRWRSKVVSRETGPILLNLGAGRRGGHETINIDVTPYPGIDKVMNLSTAWDIENESVDGIYAHHLIEHLPSQEMFIWKCLRVLKKGGFLHLTVPHSSSVTAVGCMGHNRTYSFNTFDDYLSKDFYMFGKAKFKTIGKRMNWWFMENDGNVPRWMPFVLRPINKVITFLIMLNPRVFENLWCYWVGGAREFWWRGEKI